MTPMGARQREWARQKRAHFIAVLGGKCVRCGSTEKLEFDHIDPHTRTWVARHKDPSGRMSITAREIAAGLIQLLCPECNKCKGAKELPEPEPGVDTEAPF